MALIVGLTGGIASGKSTVARRLAEHGAVHIDADALAREAVEPGTTGLRRIVERFGPGILTSDGGLDRARLGAIVFGDPVARADLNAIVHPAVRELFARRVEAAERADSDAIVVYDVPLLVEAGDAGNDYDIVVVVHADRLERIRRLVELRGMSEEEAIGRVDAQASDEQRLARAEIVVDADGSLDETLRQSDELWDALCERAMVSNAAP